MHGAWTAADLRLVQAMGIRTGDVLGDERQRGKEGVGRTPTKSANRKKGAEKERWGDRPSLRSVGLMVLAGVRMRLQAKRWGEVRSVNEGLVKKLREVQSRRTAKASVR